jgi:hypothetical protein
MYNLCTAYALLWITCEFPVGILWITPGEGLCVAQMLQYLLRFAKETLRKPLRNPKKMTKRTTLVILM